MVTSAISNLGCQFECVYYHLGDKPLDASDSSWIWLRSGESAWM